MRKWQAGGMAAAVGALSACGSRVTAGADATSGTSSVLTDSASASTFSASDTSTTFVTTTQSSATATTCTTRCRPVAVVMGYWPPTNEMLRPWSTSPQQNPEGWAGEDWNGLGFDVYSFFPEFPPDGDPTNDGTGDEGSVGSPDSDLRVDYQDTSEDFWRIVDELEPEVLVTTSRGGSIGWEVEAVEGGHGDPDATSTGPSDDWASDGYGADTHPTMDSIDPRSWEAILRYRLGETLGTTLPADAIVDAVSDLGLATVEIDADGTSGNFLSGFLGLHGLFYNLEYPHNEAAGHIHVGREVSSEDATAMIEATLAVVLDNVAARQTTVLR